MSKILIVKYDESPRKIETVEIKKFPVIIITDTHTNVKNIKEIKKIWPNNPIYCLGDITFLWNKESDFNKRSIQYFIDNKIPCLLGNHDEYITNNFLWDWNIDIHQIEYLKNLPIGFKFLLPDGTHYLAFHNRPKDLWIFTEPGYKQRAFIEDYPINKQTRGVLIGHQHKHFVIDYPEILCKLYGIGRLSKDKDYAIIDKNGAIYQKTI